MPYDPDFIPNCKVPLPTLTQRVRDQAFRAGEPLEHTRFSIIFNQVRGFATVTAHTIDGASELSGKVQPNRNFHFDDLDIPRDLQVDDKRGYHKNPWDRGHLVRRKSLWWGNRNEAKKAVQESDSWTNIAPQHTELHHSAWGEIEDFMLAHANDADRRAAVFTGPVFTPDDVQIRNKPTENPVYIPAGFFKILVIRRGTRPVAAAFLVWQRDFDDGSPVAFEPFLEQVRVTTVEHLTGLRFGRLKELDALRFAGQMEAASRAGGSGSRVAKKKVRRVAQPTRRPNCVLGPEDIVFG